MRLSVIVPAHNEELYLKQCLDSVAQDAQNTVNWFELEIIVVANNCSDGTVAIAQTFATDWAESSHIQVIVIDREESGKAGALNAGDNLATGDFLIYLDADVTIEPGLLNALVEELDQPGARYASGQIVPTTANDRAASLYAQVWIQLPAVSEDVCGCGLYAVNKEAGIDGKSSHQFTQTTSLFAPSSFLRNARMLALGTIGRYHADWPTSSVSDPVGAGAMPNCWPNTLSSSPTGTTPMTARDCVRIIRQNPAASGVFGVVYLAAWVRARVFNTRLVTRWERGR